MNSGKKFIFEKSISKKIANRYVLYVYFIINLLTENNHGNFVSYEPARAQREVGRFQIQSKVRSHRLPNLPRYRDGYSRNVETRERCRILAHGTNGIFRGLARHSESFARCELSNSQFRLNRYDISRENHTGPINFPGNPNNDTRHCVISTIVHRYHIDISMYRRSITQPINETLTWCYRSRGTCSFLLCRDIVVNCAGGVAYVATTEYRRASACPG